MQMNKNILALMPVFVFMIIMLIVSIYVRRASAKKASEGFVTVSYTHLYLFMKMSFR